MVIFRLLYLLIAAIVIATATDASKTTASQIKPQFLANIKRALQGANNTIMSEFAEDVYGHLLELCMDSNGKPNPRVTCTKGYDHARNYVNDKMAVLGLVPLGNVNRTSYLQIVEQSVNETYCPTGIANVIGMVEGTAFPDDFIVYTAHLDGPNNGNDQTVLTRGNDGVSNAYDDALAVAVGLGIAKHLQNNPPERSVIILITDGEEGWDNVGELPLGQGSNIDTFIDSEWYAVVKELVGEELLGATYWYVH